MAYTAIDKSSSFMNTKLYTGTGASNAQTGVGFQPDFTWIKNRDANDHYVLTDAVRGVTKYIKSNSGTVETTNAESLKTFDSDGFTVGTMNEVNTNNEDYVAWNWKANGAGSSNSDGDLTVTTSANTTSGVSIIKGTSDSSADRTIGHGLGTVPDAIFAKNLDAGNNWDVYFKALGYNASLILNEANATRTGAWGSSAFTTTHFQTNDSYTSINGNEFVYYVFSSRQGFSKIGSYTGNANVDGPFIYTGFRPAFIIIKNASSSGMQWEMFDNKRDGYNDGNRRLYPDSSAVEPSVNDRVRILSNGFKLVTSGGTHVNGSGHTHVYMAFGQTLVGTNNIPCTAR